METSSNGITRMYYCEDCGKLVAETLIHAGP